jgi:hypothetical protein
MAAGTAEHALTKSRERQQMLRRILRAMFPPQRPRFIPLDSFCPACGHIGCTLEFTTPREIPTGDEKGTTRTEEARVARHCNTCKAVAYEKTVLSPDKWIAK